MTEENIKTILLRNVPETLHRNIKMVAAKKGLSMQDTIKDLIAEEVKKEKESLLIK